MFSCLFSPAGGGFNTRKGLPDGRRNSGLPSRTRPRKIRAATTTNRPPPELRSGYLYSCPFVLGGHATGCRWGFAACLFITRRPSRRPKKLERCQA
ncbi:MAG: hypothetical protein [Circular genetic element sp.]|nr:MAG: hypothetical protein [Circular genetic element sp.]